MNYANLEELLIDLDLNPRSKLEILENAGKRILNSKDYFVVTEDGCCHLVDENGHISKIIAIYESYNIKKDIKKIIIPDSVISIGDWAIWNCYRLTSLTIGCNVTHIGNYAFAWCSRIVNIIMPNTVKNVGYNAFIDCASLRNVVFKGKTLKEVKAMKNYPFGIKDKSIISVE